MQKIKESDIKRDLSEKSNLTTALLCFHCNRSKVVKGMFTHCVLQSTIQKCSVIVQYFVNGERMGLWTTVSAEWSYVFGRITGCIATSRQSFFFLELLCRAQVLILWFSSSGDVYPGFQSQGGSLACLLSHLHTIDSSISPLLWHLLTASMAAGRIPHMHVAEVGCEDSNGTRPPRPAAGKQSLINEVRKGFVVTNLQFKTCLTKLAILTLQASRTWKQKCPAPTHYIKSRLKWRPLHSLRLWCNYVLLILTKSFQRIKSKNQVVHEQRQFKDSPQAHAKFAQKGEHWTRMAEVSCSISYCG